MEKSYRIRTDLNKDIYQPIEVNQSYDFLDILSLRLDQREFYRLFDANYGAVIGRVSINGGYGIPNAKVSVFVPRDPQETLDVDYYPYDSPFAKDKEGRRYNLLPNQRERGKDPCYSPVGTFPTKNALLDNPKHMEVFEKYYKYTATTNGAGDYCLMGVPVGVQAIHMDVDLSDIGDFSLKPYDLIAQGMDEKLFLSHTKFKSSVNLDELVHIYTVNKTVNVVPFWGQSGSAGINRLDFGLPVTLTPTSIVAFGAFTDEKNRAISRNCRPRKRNGKNCKLEAANGTVEVLRRLKEGSSATEVLELPSFSIDDDGAATMIVPMNLKRKVTDEFGNLVDSQDGSGVPTEAKVRIRASLKYGNDAKTRTAKYLVPNLYNDYRFGDDTDDADFFTLKLRGLYTVANYIPRYQRMKLEVIDFHTGIKDIGICESVESVPFNRISVQFNPLYVVICVIIKTIVGIINIVQEVINALPPPIPNIDIKLPCDDEDKPLEEWKECVLINLADSLNVTNKKFYNDFLVGSLYFPKFRFKVRYKRRKKAQYYKYCAWNCRDTGVLSSDPDYVNKCKKTYIVDDEEYDSSPSYFDDGEATEVVGPGTGGRGLIYREGEDFYYVARNDQEVNSGHVDLDLDTASTEKDKLMWATMFVPLGTISECAANGSPTIVDRLVPTSFKEEEFDKYLFDVTDFSSCIKPTNVEEDRIYVLSQYGIDTLSDEEDDLQSGDYYTDAEEIDVRKYLCENFVPFANNFTHNVVSTTTITDADGNDFDVVADECDGCGTDKPIRNVTPYFHYWGTVKGKTALDKLLKDYVNNCA